jgi:hypothetical protein
MSLIIVSREQENRGEEGEIDFSKLPEEYIKFEFPDYWRSIKKSKRIEVFPIFRI